MLTILIGDAIEQLKTLPAESVQCVVSSPPYWGLRDYGTATWDGGDEGCDHVGMIARTVSGGYGKQYTNAGSNSVYSGNCSCGAIRIDSQIGLEKTPAEYVDKIVAVFREVRRVLRDDGTVWCNLGDSYNSIGHKKSNSGYGTTGLAGGIAQEHSPLLRENSAPGLKHKDLVGVPWRVAFALQADGWYLRSDIIWSKPNPMPESVTDRPTKSHEYIFLLSKKERYFFDQDAVREAAEFREWQPGRENHISACPDGNNRYSNGASGYPTNPAGRNIRTVWEIATQPYPEAHFATFPEEIPKRCILAGSKAGDTILDPFGGSGTVGKVALELGRQAVLIELNPEYGKLIDRRCSTTMGLQF